MRSSAAIYVSILAIGVILAQYANYLWFEQPLVKGQAASILVSFATFGLALAAWVVLGRRNAATGWLRVFLGTLTAAWIVHLVLYRIHGDSFNYTSFLYVPILVMIWTKPPRQDEVRAAVLAFAWATSAVLVITRILEMAGALVIKPQAQGVITFDKERYFLPLNDWLGIDGRWPGPFGHNGDTAMMAAFLIVIAFSYWTWASWVFILVGAATFLITDGRASIGATAAGLLVIGMLTSSGPLARVQRKWRVLAGVLILVLGGAYMYSRPAGLTGRENIWPAFIDLWHTSPWTGVGGSGIAVSGGITEHFGHAHSLYIDELARNGVLGFVVQFTALSVGIFIAARAAGLGAPGPLAILVAYFVTGLTEPRNFWISPSVTGFLVILVVVAASAEVQHRRGSGAYGQPLEIEHGA